MGLIAKQPENTGDYELIPEDTYHGVCYAVIDLGTQHVEMFNVDAQKVSIGWELPDLRTEIEGRGDMPRATSQQYTRSLHPKSKMRPMLESWRGRAFTEQELEGFDLRNLLGANCMLQIIHKTSTTGKTYAVVVNVSKLYKGIEKKKAENEFQYFSFEDHNGEIPENIPEWIQNIIKDSYEYHEMMEQATQEDMIGKETQTGDDAPPF